MKQPTIKYEGVWHKRLHVSSDLDRAEGVLLLRYPPPMVPVEIGADGSQWRHNPRSLTSRQGIAA